VLEFARTLPGTQRPQAVIDRLLEHLEATFGPSQGMAVHLNQQGESESASPEPEHQALAPILRQALSSGTVATRAGDRRWALATPLPGRRSALGSVALLLDRTPSPRDRATLEAAAAVASLALEGTLLIDAADHRERLWEDATESLSVALCVVDRAGRLERGNRAFAELTGSQPNALAGRLWNELLPTEWHQRVSAVLTGRSTGKVELASGDRAIAVTAFAIGAPGGERRVLLFEDQTDRRRLQDRLVQSEKLTAIGQLIAGVAHDLNNPLTSVIGFADFLAESADVPPRIREPLRVIQQEAERASKIVKNLLSFARRQETRQPTALRPILEATAGLLRNNLSAERVQLQVEIDPDLPDLDLNPTQMQQVFVNLIQNAAQAIAVTRRPGTIRVLARRWMDGVAIEISDDGPGMSQEIADRVFEPFFTTKPEDQGTGLGLSICQGIVKEHGGRITLRTAPGEGATFRVELPGKMPTPPLPARPSEPAIARPLRVLVIDDEPHILHYIRATLEAWGHHVETAGDGEGGLERAVAESFDLIISDLRMPRMGGREFYEALRRRHPEVANRVAFSTGDTVRGDTLEFLATQGRPCLQKPFSLTELRALLRDASRE